MAPLEDKGARDGQSTIRGVQSKVTEQAIRRERDDGTTGVKTITSSSTAKMEQEQDEQEASIRTPADEEALEQEDRECEQQFLDAIGSFPALRKLRLLIATGGQDFRTALISLSGSMDTAQKAADETWFEEVKRRLENHNKSTIERGNNSKIENMRKEGEGVMKLKSGANEVDLDAASAFVKMILPEEEKLSQQLTRSETSANGAGAKIKAYNTMITATKMKGLVKDFSGKAAGSDEAVEFHIPLRGERRIKKRKRRAHDDLEDALVDQGQSVDHFKTTSSSKRNRKHSKEKSKEKKRRRVDRGLREIRERSAIREDLAVIERMNRHNQVSSMRSSRAPFGAAADEVDDDDLMFSYGRGRGARAGQPGAAGNNVDLLAFGRNLGANPSDLVENVAVGCFDACFTSTAGTTQHQGEYGGSGTAISRQSRQHSRNVSKTSSGGGGRAARRAHRQQLRAEAHMFENEDEQHYADVAGDLTAAEEAVTGGSIIPSRNNAAGTADDLVRQEEEQKRAQRLRRKKILGFLDSDDED
ncbi:unnamed protein product [Amoebophrya sp. A25]|nr:unnamed protein product [Amoebophrya sp. A25]|eukprot:GSA25T00016579001.1